MPTPTFLTGFEHGVAITGATPVPDDRIWHAVVTTGGTPTITTSTPRSGARCLDIPTGTGAASYVSRNVASATVQVTSFGIRFVGGLPSADCMLFAYSTGAGTFPNIWFNVADSKLYARVTANGASGFTVAADTWYLVDCKGDVSSGTRTMDVTVNGTALGQASAAVAASTISSFRLGRNVATTTATGNIRYDDFVVSATAGDYPMGDHEVLVMRPNADGTHSFTANDFIRGDAGAAILVSATDVWTLLDDTTIETIGTTDSVQQNVIRSTGYVEVNFEPAPDSVDAWGVQVQSSYDCDATGASTCFMKWNDGGTILDVYSNAPTGADFSNTTATFNSTQRATAPSGGAWTQAKLDAIRMRWGYSTDVTGSPIIHGLMLEVAYPAAPSFTGSGSLTANATIAAVGLLAFIGSAALGVTKPGISGTGALIEDLTGTASLSVPRPSIASSGALTFTGTGALLVTRPSVAGTGNTVFNVTGTASLGIPPPSIAGAGSITQGSVTGTGALSVPAPGVAASGLETFTGSGAASVPAPGIAGAGLETFAGTAGLGVSVTIAGSGLEAFIGSAALTVPQPSIVGVETTLEQGPIAIHRATLSLRTNHTATVVLPRRHLPLGGSVMDSYTTSNADIRTSNAHVRTSDAPMGGF